MMMVKWKKTGAAAMAALLLALPVAERDAEASGGAAAGDLTRNEARAVAEALFGYGASGVQYAIRDEGQLVLSDGIAQQEDGSLAPIAADTMFGIASVSKMHVTASAMMLADRGKIDIDRPLTAYIPEFRMADERYKQITPRMLMNHSSGLYGTHYKNSMFFDDNNMENYEMLLENLRVQRLKSDPGEYSVYANDGFQLLELLVERVSGKSYTAYLAQEVSGPLGLTGTKTPLDDFDRARLQPGRLPGLPWVLPTESTNVIGTGGVYSTAEELTLFAEVLTGERPELLSAAAADAMAQPEYRKGVWVEDEQNVFGYGLGWDSVDLAPFGDYGIRALTKGGDSMVYHSALIALPDHDISIALLTVGGSSLYNTAAATKILLTYLQETGTIAAVHPDIVFEPPVPQAMPDDLQAYAGLYGSMASLYRIAIEDGTITLPGLLDDIIPGQSYVYTGDRTFTAQDGRTVISFDEQTNGHTYMRVRSVLELPGLGQSVLAYYDSQQLDENAVDESVAEVWQGRNGKIYYALDEAITSQSYLSPAALSKVIAVDEQGGYANNTRILDADHAVNAVEIPVMNGRDVTDLAFTRSSGVEYLKADGRVYVDAEAVKPIYEGAAAIVTIPATGYARWFEIGEGAAGRTMKVTLPEQHSGFAVYDANGMPVNITAVTGTNTAVLPENGLIVFGGEPGDVMKITLSSR